MKLGGYHRLWIVLSFLYLVVVVTGLIEDWPTAERISNEKKFFEALPLDARKILVSEQRDEAPMAQVTVKMPDGSYQEMLYPHNWTWAQAEAAIQKHCSQAQPKVNKMASQMREVIDPDLLKRLNAGEFERSNGKSESKASPIEKSPYIGDEVTDPDLLKRLNAPDKINLLEENQPILVSMPNDYVIAFDKNAPKEQMQKVCALYWAEVEKECWHQKSHMLFLGLLFWLIPCLAIYILGFSIHWIIQGFKKVT